MGAPGKNQEVEGRAHTPSTELVLPHLLESKRIWKHSQTDAGSGEFPEVFINIFLVALFMRSWAHVGTSNRMKMLVDK